MTLKRFALLSTALPLLLCACAVQPPAAPVARSVSLTLAPGQKADAGGGMALAYDSYSDSRCPKTVFTASPSPRRARRKPSRSRCPTHAT